MEINHNIRAMVTQHSLYTNNNAMSKSLEKLSTGLKINRAQDDSAGLAMSEQMRTQIRGLGKAKQNAQDSIAALQIAEGGLGEITNLMQRQRELAIQSSNDTLTSTERKYLDDEFQELSKEIGRIALSTDYNGKSMLANGTWQGAKAGTINENNSFGAAPTTPDANGKYFPKSYTLHIGPNYSTNVGGQLSNQMTVSYAGINFAGSNLYNFTIGKYGGASGTMVGEFVNFANLTIAGTGGNSVGGAGTNSTNAKIYEAIDAMDGAIKSISASRAKIGTYINRLEYTINNIANLEFNTQDAESRIRDTDFAKETTNFTRNQIMVQASTSMLAQANSLPQSVLGLIG